MKKSFSVMIFSALLCFSVFADETVWSEIIETDSNEDFYKFKLADDLGAAGICKSGQWVRVKRHRNVYLVGKFEPGSINRAVIEDDSSFILLSAIPAYHVGQEVKFFGDCITTSILDAKQVKTRPVQ